VVLLVVNHAGEGDMLRDHLVRRGFEIEELALHLQTDWLAPVLASPPGAIVLNLPPGDERGWELIGRLKQDPATQDVPVMYTALSEEEAAGSLLEIDYLTKPVGRADLIRALERQGMAAGKSGCTILVVDDEPGILEMHVRMVQSQVPQCEVLTAIHGRQALEIMERVRPDLVLLDLMMPEVNGFEVLAVMRARELTQNVPVIVLTAQILTADDMTRLQQGVAAVLEKGLFSAAEVLAQVEATLARSKHLGTETQRTVRQAIRP
jgi:DNA-binding response OmpR family regulator